MLDELRETPSCLVWGVYCVAAAVNFLGVNGKIVHGQVMPTSIFVDRGSDWKVPAFFKWLPSLQCPALPNRPSLHRFAFPTPLCLPHSACFPYSACLSYSARFPYSSADSN